MQKHVLQAGLAGIVRNDEPVALPRVEPFDAPTDADWIGGFAPLEIVTRHSAPLARPKVMGGERHSITLFS